MVRLSPWSYRPAEQDKLLDAWETTRYKEQTARNATNSPLFLLPAEIRNRIYGYVLGGNTLHIRLEINTGRPQGDQLRNSICKKPHDTPESYPRCTRSRTSSIGALSPWHSTCTDPQSREALNLALLRTSRQIHHESALLPYSLNIFTFADSKVFHHFLRVSKTVQRRAVRSLIMLDHALDCLRWNMMIEFSNVREIALMFRCSIAMWLDWKARSFLDNMADLRLLKAHIRVRLSTSGKTRYGMEIEQWTKDIEATLNGGSKATAASEIITEEDGK